MTETPPPPSQPPRGPMRILVAMPPWLATATEAERTSPEFKERLIAWFREQRLAREQAAKPDDRLPDAD